MTARVLTGDALSLLREMPDASVQCVVTSPPYWGLRDYGTATWDGGDAACDHVRSYNLKRDTNGGMRPAGEGTRGTQSSTGSSTLTWPSVCGKCGATRIDSQLGLEPTPEEYVAALVAVFAEVRRVLRDDGTVWLNLGDSYGGAAGNTRGDGAGGGTERDRMLFDGIGHSKAGMRSKDLVGIPWRTAFAMQADGWYLRSDIIWAKPNPMPESVTDRPTKSHEYVFLLSKSARYYFDADAVRESATCDRLRGPALHADLISTNGNSGLSRRDSEGQRNIRSVWSIATEPYSGAHFATFPKKLVEPCIKAGTSEKGCCAECGAPWVRVVEKRPYGREGWAPMKKDHTGPLHGSNSMIRNGDGAAGFVDVRTTGWKPSCAHGGEPVPCVVMDPFCGSGTTGLVALRLGRSFLGIELNPEYAQMARHRVFDDAPLFNEVSS